LSGTLPLEPWLFFAVVVFKVDSHMFSGVGLRPGSSHITRITAMTTTPSLLSEIGSHYLFAWVGFKLRSS
jgi:hypothetical protein